MSTVLKATRTAITWPVLLPFARVALVAGGALVTMGILAVTGQPASPASASLFSALYLLPINVLCLIAVWSLVRREGGSLRQTMGFERARLGRDILWGLLWLVVLYVPFALAVVGTMAALYGADAFGRFEQVFAPDQAALPQLDPLLAGVTGVLAFVTFAPLNAPTEELVFRGYSQPRVARRWGATAGILLPSLAFSLQHIFFATTAPGMLVYAVAFFVWGVGSALIYRWQGRLMPLIIAHVLVNLATSAPALVLPFVVS